jgi:hypothetical protein
MKEELVGYGPIPGASFTEEVGTAAWQRPPRYVKPTDAFSDFVDTLGKKEVYEKLVFAMEEGIPVEGIANTIMYNMVSGGKCTYDVGLLMVPEIGRVLEAVAKSAGIKDYMMEIPKTLDTTFVQAQIDRIEKEEAELEEEVEEDVEEESEDKPKGEEKKGLMKAKGV